MKKRIINARLWPLKEFFHRLKVSKNTHIQNDNLLRNFKSVFTDSLYDIFEKDFRCECVSVVYNGLTIITIPAVKLNTTASLPQCIDVGVHAGRAAKLVLQKIGVMGWGYVVMCQRMSHVLINFVVVVVKNVSFGWFKVVCQACDEKKI